MQDETDRRNMRQIIIAAKMQNGTKLTTAEIEFLKSSPVNLKRSEPPVQKRAVRA